MSGFRDVPKYAPAGRQAGREGGRDTGRQAGRHRLYLGYTVILAETDDRVPHESKCMHIHSISHCSKIQNCASPGTHSKLLITLTCHRRRRLPGALLQSVQLRRASPKRSIPSPVLKRRSPKRSVPSLLRMPQTSFTTHRHISPHCTELHMPTHRHRNKAYCSRWPC